MRCLNQRDWRAVAAQVRTSTPFNHSVLDAFLTLESLATLRTALLESTAWSARSIDRENDGSRWTSHQLFCRHPEITLIKDILREMYDAVPELLRNRPVVDWWAILSHENAGLFPHCDGGAIGLNLWLTPDEFNERPGTGGMVLFDVKRTQSMTANEYASGSGGCVKYVNNKTTGHFMRVPFQFNRAVLFDAWTFHATEPARFRGSDLHTARLNLSFTFD